ncbi:hypothetical protein D3C74_412560 [compost metagenome]
MRKVHDHIEDAVIALSNCIEDKCKNGTSSDELEVLPEVVKGFADLVAAVYNG